eukprot:5194615-Amphidinium_carterae.1
MDIQPALTDVHGWNWARSCLRRIRNHDGSMVWSTGGSRMVLWNEQIDCLRAVPVVARPVVYIPVCAPRRVLYI